MHFGVWDGYTEGQKLTDTISFLFKRGFLGLSSFYHVYKRNTHHENIKYEHSITNDMRENSANLVYLLCKLWWRNVGTIGA